MADEPKTTPETVQFHYIKSNNFRVILADGAIGSVTPQARLAFSLYNERVAIPRLMVNEVSEEGLLGQVITTEGKAGFVREIECTVMMDRVAVANFRDWLTGKLAEFDRFAAIEKARE